MFLAQLKGVSWRCLSNRHMFENVEVEERPHAEIAKQTNYEGRSSPARCSLVCKEVCKEAGQSLSESMVCYCIQAGERTDTQDADRLQFEDCICNAWLASIKRSAEWIRHAV